MKGKCPVRSVYTFTVLGSDSNIAANTVVLVSSLGRKKYVSISSARCSFFYYLVFFCVWFKSPKIFASSLGICLAISLAVRPGNVATFPFFTASIKVNLMG